MNVKSMKMKIYILRYTQYLRNHVRSFFLVDPEDLKELYVFFLDY